MTRFLNTSHDSSWDGSSSRPAASIASTWQRLTVLMMSKQSFDTAHEMCVVFAVLATQFTYSPHGAGRILSVRCRAKAIIRRVPRNDQIEGVWIRFEKTNPETNFKLGYHPSSCHQNW